jgi:hypothetical protein
MLARRTRIVAIATVALCLTSSMAVPPRASAVLVYERTASHTIVVARNDGTQPKAVHHGQRPVVAPDGRHVAFLARVRNGHGDLRVVQIGSSRSVLLAHGTSTLSRVVWSPNSRYLVARSDRSDGAVLIDVSARRNLALPDGVPYGGASFAPDSSRVASASIQHSSGSVSVVDVRSGQGTPLVDGFSPAWGEPGIAFADDIGRVYLKRSVHARPRLLRDGRGDDLLPLEWATHAHRLLVASMLQGSGFGGFRAIVINSDTNAFTEPPQTFSSVDEIAQDGRTFLGELGGDVVAVAKGGAVQTLAMGARSASWTK